MTVPPLQASPGQATRDRVPYRGTRRAGIAAAALLACLSVAPAAGAEPGSLVFKQAQAEQVLGQIQALDSSLSHAIESYNLANERLGQIETDLRENRRELSLARANLKIAERMLARRLTAMYTNGGGDTTLDVVLGAETLADVLDGIETADRVSNQDTTVLKRVQRFRRVVQTRRVQLKRARAVQARLVVTRAAKKATIEQQLAARQRLLASIKDDIARIQAAERARQARLAAEARARLQAQAEPQVVATPVEPGETDPVSSEPEALPAAPPSRYGGVVGIAMRYLGTPYVYGGASPSGFDCSGFVMYVYAQVGVSLPHNAAAQYGYGTPVSRSDLQPGDLVFFNGLGHNGIYIGGGQFIHSPHTGDVVKISSLSGWYASTWVGARRL